MIGTAFRPRCLLLDDSPRLHLEKELGDGGLLYFSVGEGSSPDCEKKHHFVIELGPGGEKDARGDVGLFDNVDKDKVVLNSCPGRWDGVLQTRETQVRCVHPRLLLPTAIAASRRPL